MKARRVRKRLAWILSAAMGIGVFCNTMGAVTYTEEIVIAPEEEIYYTPLTYNNTIFDTYAVSDTAIDTEQVFEVKLVREKETYEYGEAILLKIEATNISDQTVEIWGSSGTLKESGAMSVSLKDSEGVQICGSTPMHIIGDLFYVGGLVTDDIYQRQVAPGETIVGWHYLYPSYKQSQIEMDGCVVTIPAYSFDITLFTNMEQQKDYSVSIPVFLLEGEKPQNTKLPPTAEPSKVPDIWEYGKEFPIDTFENYTVCDTMTDENQMIQFEVIREKETYQYGDEMLVAIKATNISDKVIKIGGKSSGTWQESGCITAKLGNMNNIIEVGSCMRKSENVFIAGGIETDDIYMKNLRPGETMESWQYLQIPDTLLSPGVHNFWVSLSCIEGEEMMLQKEYTINLPVKILKEGQSLTTDVPEISEKPELSSKPDASEEPKVSQKPETSQAPDVSSSAVILGDLDKDKVVGLKDAQLALKAALKIVKLEEAIVQYADVNKDGEITIEDAKIILRVSLKIENSWSSAQPKASSQP